MPPEAGELIAGRYRKLGTIGVGGMARVVLAEDERLRRRVAIKALHAEGLEDSAQRFEREARMGASLNHPNLVSIYDVATDRESVLIVMEYVEGKTLKDAIAEGPGRPGLDEETVASVIGDVAAGLDHAHEAGIVHRDVKPANILIREDGVAKLADLGIATAAESTRITRSGMVLGTAVYMAPEQLEGHKPGPAADIYSLAAVAFEALSGRKAREGASPMEIAHKAANGPAPDLLDAWPEAPPAAARALARGMARDPGDRQASAGALAEELERSLADDRPVPSAVLADADRTVPLERRAVAGVPRTPPPRTQLGRRYPRWLPATAAAVLLLAVAAVAFASLGGDDDPPSTADSAADKADKSKAKKPKKDKAEAPAAAPTPAPAEPESSESAPPAASGEVAPESADPESLNDQGFTLMNEGRYDEAIPLLQQAVNTYPEGSKEVTYAFALYNLGRSLRLAGRPDEAIPVLEARLEIPNQTATVQRELDAARAEAG